VANGEERIDVAAFELSPNADSMINAEPLRIERVCDAGTGNPNVKSRLLGYPFQWVGPSRGAPGIKGMYALSYGCETVEPDRWPALRLTARPRYPLDPTVDIVVEYSDDVETFGTEPPGNRPRTPQPIGMSGGGLWQRPKATGDDEIWSADNLSLIGLQSSWLNTIGFLRSVQIIHWLRLVAEHFPDLRDELASRFPRLNEQRL
jgi:hypothetical protein